MHALCTIIAKNRDIINEVLETYVYDEETGNGEWDYALIGGRYKGLIPVKKNTRSFLDRPEERCDLPSRLQEYDNEFVSMAKNRTVDVLAMSDIVLSGYITALTPYRLIVPEMGMDTQDIRPGDEEIANFILSYMRQHPTHTIAIVDYHY